MLPIRQAHHVTIDFEELDYQQTPLGELILRRRGEPLLKGREVFEVKLGEAFLMSSLFTDGEVALADLALARLTFTKLDVVVGGLGLGYTAAAALKHDALASLLVVEALAEVIDWHRRGLVPLGETLMSDPRCRLVNGDFFALATLSATGFDEQCPGRRFHAVLLDIDHSPRHRLGERSGTFYQARALRKLATHLHPGGVFGLWSNDPPDKDFLVSLEAVFERSCAHVVEFDNPYQGRASACTVYLAHAATTGS